METKELTSEAKEINVIDLLLSLLRHKRFIVGGTFGVAIMTLSVCFIVSPIYTGLTTVLPPQQSASSASFPSQLLSQVGGAASMLLGSALPTTSGDLFVGLLEDNSILDPVIDRFDLMSYYDIDTRVETRKMITDNVLKAEKDSKSGIVSISVDDKDPQRAADMANMFADELKKVVEGFTVSEASIRRIFFDRELQKAHEELSKAEEDMQAFQEKTGTLKIEEQAAAVLQGVALLKANIVSKEVQLQVMRTYATPSNPDLKKFEEELRALQEQLKKQEQKQELFSANALMPLGQIPSLGVEYVRKQRDCKYREAVYQIVAQQYQTARLDEAREALVVQVIQKATPPDKKTKPRAALVTALSVVLGAGFFTIAALFIEVLTRASGAPGNAERFQELKRNLMRL
jgi:capsule polysaccharide export protein KpsE/RkpR